MRVLLIAAMTAAWATPILLASDAQAQLLRVYYTTDPAVASEQPPGNPGMEWDEVDPASDDFTITLQPGDRIWFAVNNDEDHSRTKWVALEIGGDPDHVNLSLDPAQTAGFQTGDDSTPVNTVLVGSGLGPFSNQWKWRMRPQPLWERFAFVAAFAVDATIEVKSNSVCNNLNVGFVPLEVAITDGSFGAPGAMIGEPLVTEIQVFPTTAPLDTENPPTIDAPPATGPWTTEIVFAAPDGEVRPLGGVVFRTDGAGLGPDDRFDVSLRTTGTRDYDYEFFSLAPGDDGVTDYRSYLLVVDSDEPVPTAGEWATVALAALLLLAGAAALAGRRRASG